jgi:protein-arginine kinase
MLFSLQNASLIDSAEAELTQSMVEKLRAQIIREKLE